MSVRPRRPFSLLSTTGRGTVGVSPTLVLSTLGRSGRPEPSGTFGVRRGSRTDHEGKCSTVVVLPGHTTVHSTVLYFRDTLFNIPTSSESLFFFSLIFVFGPSTGSGLMSLPHDDGVGPVSCNEDHKRRITLSFFLEWSNYGRESHSSLVWILSSLSSPQRDRPSDRPSPDLLCVRLHFSVPDLSLQQKVRIKVCIPKNKTHSY